MILRTHILDIYKNTADPLKKVDVRTHARQRRPATRRRIDQDKKPDRQTDRQTGTKDDERDKTRDN